MSDINKKNGANQMRVFLRRMRDGKYDTNESITPKKDLDMRDMLKITRRLNEDTGGNEMNKKTVFDQPAEEQKMLNNFKDINVNIKFIDLEVYDSLVFWGGTVDGILQFIYKVTPDELTSEPEFKYLEGFSPDNPETDEIIKRITDYYNTFYRYWQDNLVQK